MPSHALRGLDRDPGLYRNKTHLAKGGDDVTIGAAISSPGNQLPELDKFVRLIVNTVSSLCTEKGSRRENRIKVLTS
jgi:hypothetical protein